MLHRERPRREKFAQGCFAGVEREGQYRVVERSLWPGPGQNMAHLRTETCFVLFPLELNKTDTQILQLFFSIDFTSSCGMGGAWTRGRGVLANAGGTARTPFRGEAALEKSVQFPITYRPGKIVPRLDRPISTDCLFYQLKQLARGEDAVATVTVSVFVFVSS